ncbi:MAG: isopentenyl phosphate kinase [Chloroflexota bacterium]
MDDMVFLKLGGSLITEKTQRYTPRLHKLLDLATEIRMALAEMPKLRLVLGHGSGSFGHYAVQEHLNAEALRTSARGRPRSDGSFWRGFAEVWYRASELNRYVVDALHEAGLPVVALAPSAATTTSGGAIVSWDLTPLHAALNSGVLPLIFGDIVFDDLQGGKVLSTEALMWHLAHQLKPRRILLAGLETAVWADFPSRSSPIDKITPATFSSIADKIGGSHGADVTGGMRSKVAEMLALVQAVPGLAVQIFSGEIRGNIRKAIAGETLGTMIASD